jgi:hypothetical protein
LLLVCVCGCAQSAVRSAPADAGVAGLYLAPFDIVFGAALLSLRESNFAVSESRDGRIVAGGYSPSGDRLAARVLLERAGDHCRVRVLVPGDDAAARAIHDRLAKRLDLPAPPPPMPAAPPGGDALERAYLSLLPICFDAALKVCRERDYRIVDEKRTGDHAGAISAEGKGFALSIQLHRRPDHRTRAIVQVRGRAPAENRDEAARLVEKLRDELKEP